MFQAIEQISRETYLKNEQESDTRHEYYKGEVFAMTGGTFNHAAIGGNVYALMKNKSRSNACYPMNSDMRVQTPSGLDTYPDISVYCNQPDLTDGQKTLLNPTIIFEVLSPSTRSYDRGDKFMLYRSITSLMDYVLIDSEQVFIEHFHRINRDEWLLHEYRDLTDTLPLNSVEITLSLGDIYELIVFED